MSEARNTVTMTQDQVRLQVLRAEIRLLHRRIFDLEAANDRLAQRVRELTPPAGTGEQPAA